MRLQLFSTQSTVETYAQKVDVRNRNQKSFHRLTAQGSSAGIRNRSRNHHRNAEIVFLTIFINRKKCCFAIERVEYRFYQE